MSGCVGPAVRVLATGEVAPMLFYDPDDPSMTYKVQLAGGTDWLPRTAAELVGPAPRPGSQCAQEGSGIRRGAAPPPAPRPAHAAYPRIPPTAHAQLAQPLLHREGTEERRSAGELRRLCFQLALRCSYLCFLLGMLAAAVSIGMRRDAGCTPEALSSVTPPYGGEILPANFTLVERRQFFQFTKLIDVYDNADGSHIGYFYDMNLLFYMRFGYSDAHDRIWFEARYPTSFQLGVRYLLQRCDDVGSRGKTWGVFDIKEDWWALPWSCYNHCFRKFDVERLPVHRKRNAAGRRIGWEAIMNSTLEWFHSGIGWTARHQWYMNMTDWDDRSEVAFAQQRFDLQSMGLGSIALSRWNVDVEKEEQYLPNWVVGFMAVLDDIEDEK